MKQKNNNSQLLTKSYFKQELKGIDKRFEDFDKRLTRDHNLLRQELHFLAETIEKKLDQKLSKFTDLILTTIDPLLKELETRQQDREIGASQTYETTGQLKNHEKRITQLEQFKQVA